MINRYLLALSAALALAAAAPVAAQQYSYAPTTGASSSAFGFGNESARHSQQLYRPGQIVDSTLGTFPIIRVYFRRGDLTNNPVTLTDLVLSFGQTTLRNFNLNQSFAGVFLRDVTAAYDTSSYTIDAGARDSWFSFPLEVPFTWDVSQSLVADIQFGTSSNAQFGLATGSAFGIGIRQRVYSASLTDTSGSASSGLPPQIGVDLGLAAIAPLKTLALQAYPNPARQTVSFRLPNPTAASATLIASDGRRLPLGVQSGWDAFRLPAGLATGLYQVLVEQGGLRFRAALAVE